MASEANISVASVNLLASVAQIGVSKTRHLTETSKFELLFFLTSNLSLLFSAPSLLDSPIDEEMQEQVGQGF